MTIYNFPDHLKGDTFNARQINLDFDITGAEITMQFKLSGSLQTVFSWSTANDSITVIDAALGIILMNSRILDERPVVYVYDFQVIKLSGTVKTYFKGSLTILQDITTI